MNFHQQQCSCFDSWFMHLRYPCVWQLNVELSASQTLVQQLECQLSQMAAVAERRHADFELAVKSRDDARTKTERLTTELEHCRDNHRQMVWLTCWHGNPRQFFPSPWESHDVGFFPSRNPHNIGFHPTLRQWSWSQWRCNTRAHQVKWPGWKIHRPGSALPSLCIALLR